MCAGSWIAAVLVIVGGLNWGLVGAFEFNLVNYLLGQWPTVERVVYGLVGLSAVFAIIKCAMMCKSCCKGEEVKAV